MEEALYYDHPSGERRVRTAMAFKAAQLPAATSSSGPEGKP